MKKIVFVAILGIGFTPALFAKENVMSKTNPVGIACNLPLDKHLGASSIKNSSGTVGSMSTKVAK